MTLKPRQCLILRRSSARSHWREPASSRRSSRQSRQRLRSGVAISTLAPITTVLSTATLPAPPAEAAHGDPAGGLGRYTQVIDWIDQIEMTNTLPEKDTRVLPDGSTGMVWLTPSWTSGDIWRINRCILSNVHTTAVGKSETGLPTNRSLGVGYCPGNWIGNGLSCLYNGGTNYIAGVARKPYAISSDLFLGIANLRDSSTQQFRIKCSAYLVISAFQSMKSQLEHFPNKAEVPMEGIVFADTKVSSRHILDGQKEYTFVSPILCIASQDVTYCLLESVWTPECTTNSVVGKVSVSTPVSSQPGVKMRPDDIECSTKVRNDYDPSSVMLLSNICAGYVEVHGGGRGAVVFDVVSYMDYGDTPESYGVAGSTLQLTWSGGELSNNGKRNIAHGKAPYEDGAGDWYSLSATTGQGNVATTNSAVVRLGALTDRDDNITHSADTSRDNITDTDDEDVLPVDWDRIIWIDIGQKWSQEITRSGSNTKTAGWVNRNRNGMFSASECSAMTPCPSVGKATVTWTIPQDAKWNIINDNGATTLMYLCIIGAPSNRREVEDPRPTGIAVSGEVEDHQVQARLPNLSLAKQVDNTAASSLGLSAKDWTLTVTPGRGETASGVGSLDSTHLPQGQTVLSESSSSPKSAGCGATVFCVPYSSSDVRTPPSAVNSASKILDLVTGERMQYMMVNTAQPGQVIWSKVDDAGDPLAGTVLTLTSPALNGGQKGVTNCVTIDGKTTCPSGSVDQNPRAGFLRVSGLIWNEYSIIETQTSAGYHLFSTILTETPGGLTPAASTDDDVPILDLGQVTNSRIKGSAI